MEIKKVALTTLGLMDLTSLNDDDSLKIIDKLCLDSQTEFGSVAAVCIYPQFLPVAVGYIRKNELSLKAATVINFPKGNNSVDKVVEEARYALALGADEIDMVFPYQTLKGGDELFGARMVREVRKVCPRRVRLKVIIESGELAVSELIEKASIIAIESGADFVKTSTGKVKVNATLEAAEIILTTIKHLNAHCGFKAAGGIRTVNDANSYLQLAAKIMGEDWISPDNFRFGASGLLTDVIDVLNNTQTVTSQNSGY